MNHNIAFVITELETGGAENNLARIAISLHEKGHHVTVISIASLPDASSSVPVSTLGHAGIHVSSLECNTKWQFLIARRRLRRLLAQINPDIVHSYLFHAHVISAHACHANRIPQIVGLRVADPRTSRQRVLKRVAKHAAGVIAVSNDVKAWAESKLCLPADGVLHVPNSVDMDDFTHVPNPISPPKGDELWITFVGRLHPQKGILEATPVLKQILKNIPIAKLLFVGDGPLKNKLHTLYSTELNAEQVHITGRREDVSAILSASDVFIMPSLWEGMPNALMEAMASGLPVVAFDTHGITELIGPGRPSQCIEVNKYQQFKEAIELLLSDSDLRRKLGNANRERMRDHFSIDRHVSEHESIYAKLIG